MSAERIPALTAEAVSDESYLWLTVTAYHPDGPLYGMAHQSEEAARQSDPARYTPVGQATYTAVVRVTVPRSVLRERRGTYVPTVEGGAS